MYIILGTLQEHPKWKKLKDGWTMYLPQLERMFSGIVVDATTSYATGHRAHTKVLISENNEDDDEQLTPLSLGSKRNTISCSTASSPNKKTKNQAVRAMEQNMR
jgi:hypothetical protein